MANSVGLIYRLWWKIWFRPLNFTFMAEKNLEYSGAYNFSMSQPKKGFVGAHLYNKCSLQNFVPHKRVKNTGCASKLSLIVQQCRIRSCCSEWGWGPYKLTFVLSLTFPPYVAFTKVRDLKFELVSKFYDPRARYIVIN